MKIEQSIEELRDKLIAAADEHGLSSPVVLDISQQLDDLHNSFNMANMQNKRNRD